MKHQTTVTYLYIGSPPPQKKKAGVRREGGNPAKMVLLCYHFECLYYVCLGKEDK